MSLRARVRALAERIRMPEEERRVILCWEDSEGRLTKVADTHPQLPDEGEYYRDVTPGKEPLPTALWEERT